jgi:hypothetical protein
MKLLQSLILLLTCCSCYVFSQGADVLPAAYRKNDSTFIQPEYRKSTNNSMLLNYTSRGSYNPYTGVPDWTDAHQKVWSDYRNNLPAFYKAQYSTLYSSLLRKDSINYFNLIKPFEDSYKLFFTGLFKYNTNDIEGAYATFGELNNLKHKDNFLSKENAFWLDVTSRYIAATAEFTNLFSSLEKYKNQWNYSAALNRIDSVNHPLNFYNKYLLKYNFELKQYNYSEAISALDSLKKYSPDADTKDLVVGNYKELVELLSLKQNYLHVFASGYYYYPVSSLYNNIVYYFQSKKIPVDTLQKAGFVVQMESCTNTDSVFTRNLADTAADNTAKINEVLDFNSRIYDAALMDTMLILTLSFRERKVYDFYQNYLSSNFPETHSLERTLTYKFENSEGKEYMIYRYMVAGLLYDHLSSTYKLYIYCIGKKGKLTNLAPFFE